MIQGDYFDEKAAARILEVHPRTLRRWRQRGLVACSRTPTGRVRYRIEDLMQATRSERIDVRKCPQVPSNALMCPLPGKA